MPINVGRDVKMIREDRRAGSVVSELVALPEDPSSVPSSYMRHFSFGLKGGDGSQGQSTCPVRS